MSRYYLNIIFIACWFPSRNLETSKSPNISHASQASAPTTSHLIKPISAGLFSPLSTLNHPQRHSNMRQLRNRFHVQFVFDLRAVVGDGFVA